MNARQPAGPTGALLVAVAVLMAGCAGPERKAAQVSQGVSARLLLPEVLELFALDLVQAAAIVPGDRVLDVACGRGEVALLAAPLAGMEGKVAGLDPSQELLQLAWARGPAEGPAVSWVEGDVGVLFAEDGLATVVLCQQVLALVPRPERLVAEMARVLGPEGRVAASTWRGLDGNPYGAALVQAVDQVAGKAAARELGAPFELSDAARLAGLFERDRFDQVQVVTVERVLEVDDLAQLVRDDLAARPRGGGLWRGLSAEEQQRLVQAVEAALEPQRQADGWRLPFEMLLLTAVRRPGGAADTRGEPGSPRVRPIIEPPARGTP